MKYIENSSNFYRISEFVWVQQHELVPGPDNTQIRLEDNMSK